MSTEKTAKRTELVFIIDQSGSMYGMESDTIGGINAVLAANRQLEGEVAVTTLMFSSDITTVHDHLPIGQVPDLRPENYRPHGCTALLDAIGYGVGHIDSIQKYMPDGYQADKVIFVITTDGMENDSHKFTYPEIKKMIGAKTELGWEFLFLAANIDAAAEAANLGVAEDRAVNYVADRAGNEVMYGAVAEATCAMRSQPSARMSGSWRDKVAADHKKRGRRQ